MRLFWGFIFIFGLQAQAWGSGVAAPAKSYLSKLNEALAGAGRKTVILSCAGHRDDNYPRIEMKLSFEVSCLKGEKCIEDGVGIEANATEEILFVRPFYTTETYPYFMSCARGGLACEWKTMKSQKFELRLFDDGESASAALYPAPVTYPLSTRFLIYNNSPYNYMSGELILIKFDFRPEGKSPFVPSNTSVDITATLEGGVMRSVQIPAPQEYNIVTEPSACSFSIQ